MMSSPKPLSLAICAAIGMLAVTTGPAKTQDGGQFRSWTGLYLGGHAGYRWQDIGLDAAERGFLAGLGLYSPLTKTYYGHDGIGGLQSGYNYQFGMVVVGVEGSISRGRDKSTFSRAASQQIGGKAGPLFSNYDETWTARAGRDTSLRGRVGYASGPWLWFVTGGLSWSRVDLDYNEVKTTPGFSPLVTNMSDGRDLRGWTFGGGVEFALSQNWITRLEYRRTDYGKATLFQNGVNGIDVPPTLNLTTDTIQAAINYKF